MEMKRILVLLTTCALLLSGCIKDAPGQGGNVQPGDRLPAFSVRMDDGSILRSQDLAAGPALLVFFHTTCPDCQRTLPVVQQAFENYPGVRFAAISRAESAEDIRAWWTEHGISLPFSAQEDRSVYALFASERIPRIYITETGGTVAACFDDNPCPDYADLARVLDTVR